MPFADRTELLLINHFWEGWTRWQHFSQTGSAEEFSRNSTDLMLVRLLRPHPLKALRLAARAQSYFHPGHRSTQSDRRIHSFAWRQSLLPLVLSDRAKHPY